MKSLIATILGALVLFVPVSAVADECDDLATLRALYEVRDLMFHPYVSSWDVTRRIDDHMDRLREPLPEGGYRWVDWVRPVGDGPVVKREHLIRTDFRSGSTETFEADSSVPFSVRVVVPRKRSLVRGNNQAWIGQITVRFWKDGEAETIDRVINQWLQPDTTRIIDLGVIADRAEVAVETATSRGNEGESLVEIHFLQAVPRDNPANPNYQGLEALKRLKASTDPVTLDLEIARYERLLFPGIEVTPFTTLVTRIRAAEQLLRSEKAEEQEKGRKELESIVSTLPQ